MEGPGLTQGAARRGSRRNQVRQMVAQTLAGGVEVMRSGRVLDGV